MTVTFYDKGWNLFSSQVLTWKMFVLSKINGVTFICALGSLDLLRGITETYCLKI